MTLETNRAVIPLWLDCDTGHDDAFAILLAARTPSVHLLGVSTVHGNASLDKTTRNSRAILTAIGRDDIPVYPGIAKPLCRPAFHAPAYHGESGLDGTTLLPEPQAPEMPLGKSMEAMYTALKATPRHTAWLVATGTLTNIAVLFLLYPDLAEHLGGLSIMGGAIGGGFTNAQMGFAGPGSFGNSSAFAEFNIFCDPEAAESVFSNEVLAAKTTIIPLDLTHLVLATQDVHTLLQRTGAGSATGTSTTPLRQLFHEILIFFTQTYKEIGGFVEGPPLHDPIAVVAAYAPMLLDDRGGERFKVRVVRGDAATHGNIAKDDQCGRTVATPLAKGEAGVRIPRALDLKAFWHLIDEALERAEPHSPVGKAQ